MAVKLSIKKMSSRGKTWLPAMVKLHRNVINYFSVHMYFIHNIALF